MFENKNHVNETEQNKRTTNGQFDITTLKDSQTSKSENFNKSDRENFYHWELPKKLWVVLEEETTAGRHED